MRRTREEITRQRETEWKAFPWRLASTCTRCGVFGPVAGTRRASVRCLTCYVAPTRRVSA